MQRLTIPVMISALMVSRGLLAAEPFPLDATAPAPVIQYSPALGVYQPYREAKVGSWRLQNDQLRGGDENHNEQPARRPADVPASPHKGHHMDHKEPQP